MKRRKDSFYSNESNNDSGEYLIKKNLKGEKTKSKINNENKSKKIDDKKEINQDNKNKKRKYYRIY